MLALSVGADSNPCRRGGRPGRGGDVMDASARTVRRDEDRWERLVQNAVYGIFRLDAEGRFLLANPALASMLGYASVVDLLCVTSGSSIFRDRGQFDALFDGARTTDRIDGVEVEWVRRDGTPITARLSGRAVRGAAGAVEGLELLAEDVTERRSLERQVQCAQKMEAVGRLAGGIAHDFNNLLVAILGYGDMLARSLPEGDPRLAYADQVRKAAERAASLTRQLLAFSRRQVIDRQPLSLSHVVTDMEPMLRRLIGENIRLECRLDPSLARTRADRGQVEQVVMNLVVNARDAMPHGGALTIATRAATISGRREPAKGSIPAGRYAVLSVEDTGVGMSPEVQSHLFEPFFTTKEEGKGTGLGLSTVYGIVTGSGGTVSARSAPGKGTAFDVYWPTTADAPVEEASEALPPRAGPSGETVLLVEDDEPVRELARQILADAGYRVVTAADAAEAMTAAQGEARAARVLVTDLVLPDASGLELAERVRTFLPGVGLLLTSGYTTHEIEVETLHGLKAGFLQKPFRMAALLRGVEKALAASRG